jgi:hypothetical protein
MRRLCLCISVMDRRPHSPTIELDDTRASQCRRVRFSSTFQPPTEQVGSREKGACEHVEEPDPHPHQQKSSDAIETSENKDKVPEQVTCNHEERLELDARQIFTFDSGALSCLQDIVSMPLKPCRVESRSLATRSCSQGCWPAVCEGMQVREKVGLCAQADAVGGHDQRQIGDATHSRNYARE